QDTEKLQVVAGSLREAFGIIQIQRRAGIIEREGNPQREYIKDLSENGQQNQSELATQDHDQRTQQGPEANTFDRQRSQVELPQQFALAATTLKQDWQELPDITYIADNLLVEETEQGLNIQIVDQEGRAMFPEGSKFPFEATRSAIAVMAPIISRLPNQVRITGHTAAGGVYGNPRYGARELSADRANVTRRILEEFGLAPERIHSVVGRASADPLFANDPYLASNQRISILVLYEEPPVPSTLEP
ncbi:MAG TPA: OmpA family protein, partial [Devosiaceae bacterium]|nr:OmpA family protein [Devosiaceae bacterium]